MNRLDSSLWHDYKVSLWPLWRTQPASISCQVYCILYNAVALLSSSLYLLIFLHISRYDETSYETSCVLHYVTPHAQQKPKSRWCFLSGGDTMID